MDNGKETDPITEAAETVRKDAYAAGYRDALAAISSALSDLAGATPEGTSRASYSRSKMGDGGPTVGTIPHYVWMAVSKRPGMTNSELIAVIKENAPKASTAVIRTSIGRVRRKYKLIVSRHGKWFPA